MRLIPIDALKPGMIIGKKIYNSDGLVLLSEGVELTDRLIRRLGGLEISYVYIQDAMTEDIVVQELLSEETRLRAIQSIRSNFKNWRVVGIWEEAFTIWERPFPASWKRSWMNCRSTRNAWCC